MQISYYIEAFIVGKNKKPKCWCRVCRNSYAIEHRRKNKPKTRKYNNEWYAKNKELRNQTAKNWRNSEEGKKYHRTRHLKTNYGISVEDFDKLAIQQKSKCKICAKKDKLHVDHCHKTGIIRGLLCGNCNRGIGLLEESDKILKAAIKYLKEFKK